MVEIDNELPTHYVVNEWQPKLTQIDRVFVSLPSWQVLPHHICAVAPECPELMHERGLSDHVPVIMSIEVRSEAAASEQRIPMHFFKDPEFK
eukprot:2553986-Pyramimonas_sp.AAC.1